MTPTRHASSTQAFRAARLLALACLVGPLGCSTRTTNLASSPTPTTQSDGGREPRMEAGTNVAPEASLDATLPTLFSDAGVVICGDHPCACSNGIDDDGDLSIDGFDPECTGAFDDDELTFATGVHGESKEPRCRDCFFDANSGSGDDGCRIAPSCTVDGTASDGTGSCATCKAAPTCIDACAPRAPNGCDCFGCCDVTGPNGLVAIRLSDTCSLAVLDDPTKCPRCVKDTTCQNECGRCELCPGKTEAELPADCGGYNCEGAERCGPQLPCANDGYCQLGCCIPPLI